MCKYTKSKGEFLKNDRDRLIVDNLPGSSGRSNLNRFQ